MLCYVTVVVSIVSRLSGVLMQTQGAEATELSTKPNVCRCVESAIIIVSLLVYVGQDYELYMHFSFRTRK